MTGPIPLKDYDEGKQTEKRGKGFRLLSYAEMEALPEPEWLVEGVIQKRSTALLFGKSNSFKSFLAIDIGLSVEAGLSWHGHDVSQGGVLFVATEGANGVGRMRVPAWYEHHQVSREQRGAYLYPMEIRLDVADDVTALIEAMNADGPFALMVLDIFGGSMAGSEIEDKTARAWVHGIQRILRETGAAILTVAHTGWQDDSRARMHTHFWGSFDSRMRVEGDKEALTSTLTIERHKDADSSGQWGFRLVQANDSLVPERDDAVKPEKQQRSLSPKLRLALGALDEALIDQGQRKEGNDWPPCPVVTIEAWRQQFYRMSGEDSPDTKRQAFKRARDGLHQKGLIAFFDDHVWKCT